MLRRKRFLASAPIKYSIENHLFCVEHNEVTPANQCPPTSSDKRTKSVWFPCHHQANKDHGTFSQTHSGKRVVRALRCLHRSISSDFRERK